MALPPATLDGNEFFSKPCASPQCMHASHGPRTLHFRFSRSFLFVFSVPFNFSFLLLTFLSGELKPLERRSSREANVECLDMTRRSLHYRYQLCNSNQAGLRWASGSFSFASSAAGPWTSMRIKSAIASACASIAPTFSKCATSASALT